MPGSSWRDRRANRQVQTFTRLAIGLAVLTASCGTEQASDAVPVACDAVAPEVVEAIIGPFESTAFEVERLSECRWTATDTEPGSQADGTPAEIVLQFEAVPDAELFVTHSIEGTPSDRVVEVDVGEQGVVFTGEAALARQGSHIAMVTGTVADTA